MKPILTKTTNHNFKPPEGQEDKIGHLPCEIREDTIYSVWELDEWERKAIVEGQNIELGVGWIGGFPPVSLSVTPAQEISPEDLIP